MIETLLHGLDSSPLLVNDVLYDVLLTATERARRRRAILTRLESRYSSEGAIFRVSLAEAAMPESICRLIVFTIRTPC